MTIDTKPIIVGQDVHTSLNGKNIKLSRIHTLAFKEIGSGFGYEDLASYGCKMNSLQIEKSPDSEVYCATFANEDWNSIQSCYN